MMLKNNTIIISLLIISVIFSGGTKAENNNDEVVREQLYLDAARNAAKAGDNKEALQRFEKYLLINPNDGQAAFETIGILSQMGREEEAHQTCKVAIANLTRLHESDQSNAEVILQLARLESWLLRYDKAAIWYDKYVALKPNDKMARIGQARLAGWDLRYDTAEKYYKKIIEDFPEDEAVSLEMRAKTNNWLGRNIKASEYYEQAIEHTPDEVELTFDLGQIYDRRKMYAKASEQYQRTLEIAPSHNMAAQTMIAEKWRQKQYIRSNNSYLKKKGRDGKIDIESYTTEMVYSPFRKLQDAEWLYRAAETKLSVSGRSLSRTDAGISVKKYFEDSLVLKLNTLFSNYSQRPHHTFQFDGLAERSFGDLFTAAVTAGQQDIVENIDTLNNGISRFYVGSRISAHPFKHASFFGDFKRFWYSDHNHAYEYDLRGEYKILQYPTILKVIGKFYKFDTSTEKSIYWTPNVYWNKSIGLGWYHYIDQQHYEGSEDLYYYIEGYLSTDNDGEEGQEVKTGIVYNSNQQFSMGVEYTAFISDVYDQSHATAFIRYRF